MKNKHASSEVSNLGSGLFTQAAGGGEELQLPFPRLFSYHGWRSRCRLIGSGSREPQRSEQHILKVQDKETRGLKIEYKISSQTVASGGEGNLKPSMQTPDLNRTLPGTFFKRQTKMQTIRKCILWRCTCEKTTNQTLVRPPRSLRKLSDFENPCVSFPSHTSHSLSKEGTTALNFRLITYFLILFQFNSKVFN